MNKLNKIKLRDLIDLIPFGYFLIDLLNPSYSRKVFLSTKWKSEQEVVIKVILKYESSPEKTKKHLDIASVLQHENIVKILDFYQTSEVVCIIMEMINNNLYKHILQKGCLTEEKSKKTFLQLSRAMDYMHNTVRIAHRGITSCRILLDDHFNIKLTGFGQSKQLGLKEKFVSTEKIFGNENYTAPEIFTQQRYDPLKADVFSMGIVLYFMLTGTCPSRAANKHVDIRKIDELSVSQPCRELLVCLLHPKPSLRLTAKEILGQDWLRQSEPFSPKRSAVVVLSQIMFFLLTILTATLVIIVVQTEAN